LEAVQNPLLLSLTRSLPYDVDVCLPEIKPLHDCVRFPTT